MNVKRLLKYSLITACIIIVLTSVGTIPPDVPLNLRSSLIGFRIAWGGSEYDDIPFIPLLVFLVGVLLFFAVIELLVAVANRDSGVRIGLRNLVAWYSDLPNKQRWIVFSVSIVLSLFPVIGWSVFLWWLLPLIIYLEFKRPST